MKYVLEPFAFDINRAHRDDAGIDMRTPERFVLQKCSRRTKWRI